jgi:Ca-activated chloride channel homolog
MRMPGSRAIVISFLLVAWVHKSGAQKSQASPSATAGPFRPSGHALLLDEAKHSIATLNNDAELRSLLDRPISVQKAGQRPLPGLQGPQGGLGNVGAGAIVGVMGGTAPFDTNRAYMMMLQRTFDQDPLEDPTLAVSKLDLKAPGKARKEYERAFKLLNQKEYQGAAEHLTVALSIYPEFVAAHNALGSSYLGLGQHDKARDEFAKAVALDDHLPISHLNLGCAELALKHYPQAEAAVQKASTIAPMDLQVLTALAYAQLLNHNYSGTIATARQVHSRKHDSVAVVHFYAAAAWDGLSNQEESQGELQTLLKEDPQSAAGQEAVGILAAMKEQTDKQTVASLSLTPSLESAQPAAPTGPAEVPAPVRKLMQDAKEAQQIADAEASCEGCESQPVAAASNVAAPDASMGRSGSVWTLHKDVDEVSVFFAATDHGKAVSDLVLSDVAVLDNHQAPVSVLGFRSEAQLPLRLGLVIDASESVTNRFSFEQSAAANFIRKVVTGQNDLGFVVGFANSVLLLQDFTADNSKLTAAVDKLAPAGGTAAWDAVAFAAEKVASRPETQPVARVLVVISDGEDNSSNTTLKEAIAAAENREVIVYAVSTQDSPLTVTLPTHNIEPGDHALRTLADLTGGTAFFPGSLRFLNHSLDDLQEVIRSRYMISYRPALFKRDGQYRAINIKAEKSGRKLRVYSRKGYYAQASSSEGGL